MKKFATTILSLLISGSAYALPLGNPIEASLMDEGLFCPGHYTNYCDPCAQICEAWSLRIGFYGDYVFNRHMEVDDGPSIRKTEVYTNAVYLVWNAYDQFDLFATVGGTRIKMLSPGSAFSVANRLVELETETSFSWSLGVRGTLWECGCLGIGAEAQYFKTRPDINFVKSAFSVASPQNVGISPSYGDGTSLQYREWQIGIGATYRMNIAWCDTALLPYVGIKWGNAQIDGDNAQISGFTIPQFESQKQTGFAIGATLLGANAASVTVEGRFASEKAVYVNGQFRF